MNEVQLSRAASLKKWLQKWFQLSSLIALLQTLYTDCCLRQLQLLILENKVPPSLRSLLEQNGPRLIEQCINRLHVCLG